MNCFLGISTPVASVVTQNTVGIRQEWLGADDSLVVSLSKIIECCLKYPSQHLVSGIASHHERLIRSAQEDERVAVQCHTSRAFSSQNLQSLVYLVR